MANLNKLFSKFNDKITLTNAKCDALKTSRDALRQNILRWFKDKEKLQPNFSWQGSFAMKTMINPIGEGEYDLDNGVYLQGFEDIAKENWISPETAHSWIKDAVQGSTSIGTIDKNVCVRVRYAAGYHIDLPIYICQDDITYLANKKEGWVVSDPKEFTSWFIDKVKDDRYGEQLRRTVKYMKAWRDCQDVPLEGIEITILTTNCFNKYEGRDDRCIKNTVEKMIDNLEDDFSCIKPVALGEDLFKDISEQEKELILTCLQNFKDNLNLAINEEDGEKASEYLQRSFGNRFPKGEKSDTHSVYASSQKPGVLKHDGRSA